MEKRLPLADELLMNGIGANGCSQGKIASCDSFGKAHHVGNYARQFTGKHSAAASEAGQDLVRDQQHIVFGCEFTNTLQELYRMNNHPARSLQDRFDNNGGHLVSSLSQQLFQRVGALNVAALTPLPYPT